MRHSCRVGCLNLLTLVCSVVLLASCKFKKTDSSLRHAAGRLAMSEHASNWIATPPEEFKAAIERYMKESPVLEHPIRERLQVWVDAMDQLARQTAWGQQNMRNTPKPYVVVLNTDEINAFASGAEVRYDAAAAHTGRSGSSVIDGKCLSIVDWGVQVTSDDSGLVFSGDKTLLPEVVERLRQNLTLKGKTCKPVLKENAIVETENCTDQQSYRAPAFCAHQTSNAIVVLSGLIKSLSEEQTIAVIAHELGHYYKAHPSDFSALNSEGYYYREKDAGRPERPAQINDKDLTSQIEQLKEKIRVIKMNQNGASDAHYPPYLLARLLGQRVGKSELEYARMDEKIWKKLLDDKGKVSLAKLLAEQCRIFHNNLQDCDTFASNIAAWGDEIIPYADMWTPEEKKYYKNIDDAFFRFSEKIFLSFSDVLNSQTTDIPVGFLLDALVGPVYENGKKSRESFEKSGRKRISVDEFFKDVANLYTDYRIKVENEFQSIRAQGIGWYNHEQEADEIAGELLSGLGLDPHIVSAMIISLVDLHPEHWKRSALTADACKKLLSSRFGFGTRTITPVTLQDWFDPHHDGCYRIFNIERDLFAHQYKVETQNLPKFTQSWTDVVKSMPDSPKPKPEIVAYPTPPPRSGTGDAKSLSVVRRAVAKLRIVPAHD